VQDSEYVTSVLLPVVQGDGYLVVDQYASR